MTPDFKSVLGDHLTRYPLMLPQDCAKLAYQSEFGPAHFSGDLKDATRAIEEEWRAVPPSVTPHQPEPIGGGLCRFPLAAGAGTPETAVLLARLFCMTARGHGGSQAGLRAKLECVEELNLPGVSGWLETYRRTGCPAVHHSERYRRVYAPHYRLLRQEYAVFFPILSELDALQRAGRSQSILVGLDGCCGSGKSRLAELCRTLFSCRVVHTDDFYLPAARRESDWNQRPAGNMDLERLYHVVQESKSGKAMSYRPFRCHGQTLAEPLELPAATMTVVEGCYALHPSLRAFYDRKLVLTCSPQEQERRLILREGSYYSQFQSIWLPMEQIYHQSCGMPDDAQIFDTELI